MSIEVKSYKSKVNAAVESKIKRALKIIGMQTETYAKQLAPVDTGLLRNSITFAIGGQPPNTTVYEDDSGQNRKIYSEVAPPDENGQTTLYVGTNVEYAPYQELGHHTVKGEWVNPQAFLRPAMENHIDEFRTILKKEIG